MEEKSAERIVDRSELEKLTATKLRELCGEKYPEIVGVTGMEKEAIIEAIIGDEVRRGLRPKTDIADPKGQGASDLKVRIRLFKRQRDEALAAKDRHGLREARVGIKRLKRQSRRHRKAS